MSTTAGGRWRPGTTVLGEFTVERELAGGGTWRVALVRDRDGGRHTVRRVEVADLVAQHRVLTDVRRWIDLPPHPHLAACRFVRVAGAELLVFAEYAAGGSLADHIADGRLYAGADPVRTVLRLAAEVAWGLDAAHAMGLPHLDVAPANVVLTEDGTAKLTDFATPRPPEHLRHLDADGTIREAPEGAYAAPEQVEDQPVGPAADLWSWAVVVLEMFAGERTWPSGVLADAVLEQLAARERWRVPVPPGVVDLLRRCLRFDPAQRPRSMGEVAATLATALPGHPRPTRPSVLDGPPSGPWRDPRAWLAFAYATAGLDPRTATVFWPSWRSTRRAKAGEDLRAFTEAQRVLDETGGPVLARARLRADTGRAALRAGEVMAGAANLRACVDLLDGRTDEDSRVLLATVLTELAVAAPDQAGPATGADRAIAVAEQLEDHPEVLAGALLARAGTLADLDLYDRARSAYERAGDRAGALAAGTAKARALHAAGAREQAERVLDGLTPADDALAGQVALERATLAAAPADQLHHARRVVDLLTPLVNDAGRHELAADLGRGWFLLARALESLGRREPAMDAYRMTRYLLTEAVVRDGRDELTDKLATAYDREVALADPRAGAEIATRAVELWQRLADLDGPGGWTVELAAAREKLGTALMEAGDEDGAREQFDEVLRLVPEQEIGTSARRRTLAAMAHRQHGVLLRRAGDPMGACGRYRHALYLLADDEEPGFTRVLVLESLSAALGDAGHLDESAQVLAQSTEELAPLVDRGLRGEADLADSYRRLTNARYELGDFHGAQDAAQAGLEVYTRLVGQGRDDLVEAAARLRASYGYLRHRLSDVDGAVVAITAARARLGSDPVVARGLDSQLELLRSLTAMEPDELDGWFDAQREVLAEATTLSGSGLALAASRLVEEVLGSAGWVARTHPGERAFALCGLAGVQLGMSAMPVRRNGAARHGFLAAVEAYGRLVADGRRQYVDDWARAHVGLASLLTVVEDDAGADEVVTDLLAKLADAAPAALPTWRERVVRAVADMRATR
ncbi:protein kinase [Actinophytocola xanthii]|uniref:Protein kinase domain-containing protein n=1 Tax=Actinophytocola xanthii TaxID=1912961 RepID=A0A1Q8CR16_9PSEU|nr:protein kinase [Actinophytocola xanthii]OLF16782.1 hypothetical protein BU204_15065 [Actinophytocola xanthii]